MKTLHLVVAVVAFVLLPIEARAIDQLATAKPPAPVPTTPAIPTSSSIVYIQLDDTSGTMRKFIDAVRGAAADQLRKLLPGDVLARIEFDAEARLVSLVKVRDASDVENALKIDLRPAKGQKTEISRGLLRAREIVTAEALGRLPAVVVLASDGELDPRDSIAAERQRLADVANWWRNRAKAAIVMVAPTDVVRASKPFADLAKQLGARTVGLEEFQTRAILTREIEAVRPAPGPSIPVQPQASRVRNAAVAVAVLLALGLALLLLRRKRRAGVPAENALGPHTETRAKAHVVVTAGGSRHEVVIDVRPDETAEILTIGGPGSIVEVPGYRARLPITITSTGGVSGDVRVPEGVSASIGADRIDARSGAVRFIGRTALKTAGAHIQIRLVPERVAS